jgi:hypothetical protein
VIEGLIFAALVSIMILLFLGDWRMTLIATLSLPLSVLGCIVGLYSTGNTINAMTLAGMALAIGPLVDEAIVELENNHRNYHMGKSRIRAAIDIDDGTLASVVWLDDAAGSNNAPAGSKVRRPLRVDELIVVSNQGELEDGSTIDATVLPAN